MEHTDEETTIQVGKRTFTIVESVPRGYEIWNIGDNMVDGYLPLCYVFPGTYDVDGDNLKAIECKDAQTILAAIGYGPKTVSEMEAFIKKYEHDEYRSYQAERIKKAMPVLKTIKFD